MDTLTKHAALALVAAGMAAATPAVAQQAQKSWTDKITIKGDLRYRYEAINDDSKKDADGDTFERQRDRIRARLGAESKISDTLKGGIELSTGQSDPVSGNQTLGDIFGKKDMKLNLAYFDWTAVNRDPQLVNIIGGKMKNPFLCVSDLIWDNDMTPDGLAAKAQAETGPVTFLANAAYWWLQERSTGDDDTKMLGAQTALQFKPINELSITLGASYYGFSEVEGYNVLDWEAKNNSYGNSTKDKVSGATTNKIYKYDYAPVELFAEVLAFVNGFPVTLYAQTVSNDEAKKDNTGFLVGVTAGKAKNEDTFEVGYSYAYLEKDAVLGALTDSDRWGGGTDGRGHKVHGKYQFTKNFQAGATYFLDERKISDSSKTTDYNRLQLDLVYAF